MAPIVIRYPLDPTGSNPNNLIIDEEHELKNRRVKAFATYYGGFFTESVIVKDIYTQKILVKNVDYFCTELYQVPSAKYDKEICSVIVIVNEATVGPVSVTYQAIGGPWASPKQAIIQMFDKLHDGSGPVWWNDIEGKPTEFKPSHHMHDFGDPHGFENVVAELEKMHLAILMVDRVGHDEIYRYIDVLVDGLADRLAAELSAHILSGDHDWRYFTKTLADDRYVKFGESLDITLDGPLIVYRDNNYSWQITNYDSFSTYRVSTNQGIAKLTHDKVNFNMPVGEAGSDPLIITITRDNVPRQFVVKMIVDGIAPPTIELLTNDNVCNLLTPTVRLSNFLVVPSGSDSHISTDMQLSDNVGFTSIIWQSMGVTSGPSKFEATLPTLDVNRTYYLRGRFNGNAIGNWVTTIINTHNQQVVKEPVTRNTGYAYQYEVPANRTTNYNSEVIVNTNRDTTFNRLTTRISDMSDLFSYIGAIGHPVTQGQVNQLVDTDATNIALHPDWSVNSSFPPNVQVIWSGIGFAYANQGPAGNIEGEKPSANAILIPTGTVAGFNFDSYAPTKKGYGWWKRRLSTTYDTTVTHNTEVSITTFIPVSRVTHYNSTIGRYTTASTQFNTDYPIGRFATVQKTVEIEPDRFINFMTFTGYIRTTRSLVSKNTSWVVGSDKNTTHSTTWQTNKITSVFNTSSYTCHGGSF